MNFQTASPTKKRRQATKPISAKDCWFVIGAHLAGSSERQCSELSGLSKTVTHNIIANFKKLGSPHPWKLPVAELMNSRRDSQDTTAAAKDAKKKKRKMSDADADGKPATPRRRGRPPNPPEPPFFTQAIINETLKKARHIPAMSTTTTITATASTTDFHSNQSDEHSNPNLNRSIYPLERPNTPPNDKDQEPGKRRVSLTPPLITTDEPLTPRSTTSPPPHESEEQETACAMLCDTGHEDWTLEEDKELLLHVLGLPVVKNIKWKEAEKLFGDRHVSRMCSERWEYIKKQLMKDIKSTTM